MQNAGACSFDNYGYMISATLPEKIKNLYAAYNAYLSRHVHKNLWSQDEMYFYAANYGVTSDHFWESFNACEGKLSIKKGLLASDHPTRDEYAPPLPDSDPVIEFKIPSLSDAHRVKIADLEGGYRLFMTNDKHVRERITRKLGDIDQNPAALSNIFSMFWMEDSSSRPALAFFRFEISQVTVLLPGSDGVWSHRHSLHHSSDGVGMITQDWKLQPDLCDFGILKSGAFDAFLQLRGLFRQLGDEQTWLKLLIDINPHYNFSDFDRELAMRCHTTAELYALRVLRDRWPEYERRIIGNPVYVLYYAGNVLYRLDRKIDWPEGEQEIIRLGNPWKAVEYALYIRRQRWPDAENLIGGTEETAFRYASELLNGKFGKGEATMARDAYYAYKYALLTGERFLMGEDKIKTYLRDQWETYVTKFHTTFNDILAK
jgi:hypothetical protein